jgi:hypothetical protein
MIPPDDRPEGARGDYDFRGIGGRTERVGERKLSWADRACYLVIALLLICALFWKDRP